MNQREKVPREPCTQTYTFINLNTNTMQTHTSVHVHTYCIFVSYLDLEKPDRAQRQKRADIAGGQQQLIIRVITLLIWIYGLSESINYIYIYISSRVQDCFMCLNYCIGFRYYIFIYIYIYIYIDILHLLSINVSLQSLCHSFVDTVS
jgi:hypothetical protein